jgi:hypothetical protein
MQHSSFGPQHVPGLAAVATAFAAPQQVAHSSHPVQPLATHSTHGSGQQLDAGTADGQQPPVVATGAVAQVPFEHDEVVE